MIATANDSHVALAERGDRGRVCRPWSTSRWRRPPPRRARWSSSPSERGVPLTVFHNRRWDSDQLTAAPAARRGPARGGAALRVAVRALEARASRRRLARLGAAGAAAAGCCSTSAPTSSTRRWCCSGRCATSTARSPTPRRARRRRRLHRARPRLRRDLAPAGVAGDAGARTAAAGQRHRGRLRGRGASTDRRTPCGAGARPGDGGWGAEPEERWGRLVAGERSEPVPSSDGAWPRFYAELARRARRRGRAAGRPARRGRRARDPRARPEVESISNDV